MDSGTSAHLTSNAGTLQSTLNHNINHSVIVENGSSILVTSIGSTTIHSNTKSLALNHVLITHNIVKNLIYVREFYNR